MTTLQPSAPDNSLTCILHAAHKMLSTVLHRLLHCRTAKAAKFSFCFLLFPVLVLFQTPTCSLYWLMSSKDFMLLTAKTQRKPSPVLMYWSRMALQANRPWLVDLSLVQKTSCCHIPTRRGRERGEGGRETERWRGKERERGERDRQTDRDKRGMEGQREGVRQRHGGERERQRDRQQARQAYHNR